MSIIIKGMEMPKNCDQCELCACYVRDDGTEENYRCCLTFFPIHDFDVRHENCPLIELPPHGLIDKQMLLRNIADNQMANSGQRHDLEYGFWQRMWDYINDAPTIIEAEKELDFSGMADGNDSELDFSGLDSIEEEGAE